MGLMARCFGVGGMTGLLLCGVFCVTSAADEVVLDNGCRLVGKVTELTGDFLTLTSDYAEPIKLKKERIIRVTTDGPAEVHLKSGEVLKGKLNAAADSTVTVEQGEGRGGAVLDWPLVTAINPPPPKRWKGSVSLAGNLQTGNTDRSALTLGAEAQHQGDQDRYRMRFLYEISQENGTMTSRSAYGALKYDYFFTKRLYGYLGVEMLNDKFKNLNLRTVVGPGLGFQVWDTPVTSFSLEGGIAYFSEDRREGEDEHWITARLAGNYRHKLTEAIVFTEQLVLYPSLKKGSDFKLRNEAALATALGASRSLKLGNILDYDNAPSPGVQSTDSNFLAGLQYAF